MKTSRLKSIVAVLAGMIVIIVIILFSTGTDVLFVKLGVFPPIEIGSYTSIMLMIALIYRCIYAILGGYVTSKMAPDKPIYHVIILGVIGTILSILGTIVGWNLSEHWYPIALVITAIPCTWLGAKIYLNKL